ncbi:hypothetical protein JCM8202_001761 [Rhodotorula sphaerocarpa]
MPLLSFPDNVPPGINPYEYFGLYIDAVFNPVATQGFKARLIVLWALTGYGIVASLVYLGTIVLDSRRRQKSLWLFRLVRRSNGRYLVASSPLVFAIASFLACSCLIGYIHNFYRVALQRSDQSNAFYWRTLIWLPLGAHLWLSSWSSLQAGVLASRSPTVARLLHPILVNTLYVGGLVALIAIGATLDVIISVGWNRVWLLQRRLAIRSILLRGLNPNATAEEARQALAAPLGVLNHHLDKTVDLMRAIGTIYSLGAFFILLANIGGLALYLTLKRQIRFNTDRLSPPVPAADPESRVRHIDIPRGEGAAPLELVPSPLLTPNKADDPQSPFFPVSLGRNGNAGSKTSGTKAAPFAVQHVLVAQQVQQYSEYLGTDSEGSPINSDSTPRPEGHGESSGSSCARRWAARRLDQRDPHLLALRKIQADVLVVSRALMALEAVYFAIVWTYLIGVDVALTFLAYNIWQHLPSQADPNPPQALPPALFLPAVESDDADLTRRPFDAVEMRTAA